MLTRFNVKMSDVGKFVFGWVNNGNISSSNPLKKASVSPSSSDEDELVDSMVNIKKQIVFKRVFTEN